jgi:hypothetical protein
MGREAMTAEARARRLWMVLGVVFLLIPAAHLFRFFTQRSDIWWTPKPLAVPLAESADRVEIYVRGQLLQEQVKGHRLQVLASEGAVTLDAADVTVRFNNRDRVRAEQIPGLLGAALVTAVAAVFVVLSALGMWPPTRPERQV